MGVLRSKLVVSMLDRLSGPARRATMAAQALRAAGTGMGAGVAQGVSTMNRASRRMGRAVRRMNGTGPGAMGATVAGAAFLASEVRVQSAMNRTQAILNESTKAFQVHKDLVVELSKKWPATSSEIAEGASELAMAGMNMAQVNEVLEATIQGSMASGESIKTVGMGVTDVAMALGRSLTKETFFDINNVLAAGATNYAQDYSQFLRGLAKSAPLARVTGTSLEQMVGMLGILADAGFKAERGGTALRTMMIKMGAPTPKALAQLKKYELALEDFRGQFDRSKIEGMVGAGKLRGMLAETGVHFDLGDAAVASILSDRSLDSSAMRAALAQRIQQSLEAGGAMVDAEALQDTVGAFISTGFSRLDVVGLFKALGERGAANDIQALADIFGLRFGAQGSSIANALFAVDPTTGKTFFDNKFDTLLDRIPNAVDRFAKILMQGLPGAVKRLASAFDGLLRTMAKSGAMETVSEAFDWLREVINSMAETSPATLKAITLGILGLGLIAPITFSIASLGGALLALSAIVPIVAGGLGVLASIGLPALAGLAAAGGALYALWDHLGAFLSGFGSAFYEWVAPVLPILRDLGAALGGLLSALGVQLGGNVETWRQWGRIVGSVLGGAIRAVGELLRLVTLLVKTTRDVAQAFGKLGDKIGETLGLNASQTKVLKSAATGPLGALQGAMRHAGRTIAEQLGLGIRQGKGAVAEAMEEVGQEVKDHVPQSPAKKGPLRGLTGLGIMTEIARGMDKRPIVAAMRAAAMAARGAAGEMAPGAAGAEAMRRIGGDLRRAAAGAGLALAAGGLVPPGAAAAASLGDVTVHVHVSGDFGGDAEAFGRAAGRETLRALREAFSDGGT